MALIKIFSTIATTETLQQVIEMLSMYSILYIRYNAVKATALVRTVHLHDQKKCVACGEQGTIDAFRVALKHNTFVISFTRNALIAGETFEIYQLAFYDLLVLPSQCCT